MKRVLFLAESYHPVLGGGETHIRRLASELMTRGRGVTVLTRRSEAGWPAEEQVGGVRVVRVGPAGGARAGKYLMTAPAVWAMWRERSAFDVCVVRGTRVLGLPGLLASHALGKRSVLQCEVSGEMSGDVYTWGTRFATGLGRALARRATQLRNRLLRGADAFVTISKATHAEFLAAGLDPRKVHNLPHGIDTREFRPASQEERRALRGQLGLPEAARVVIFSGRLLRGKGLETLLDAFPAVASRHPEALLVLLGSGAGQALDVEGALRERAAGLGLAPRVRFAGRVDNVSDWLRAAEVFAFPSLFEAMPLAVLEAAACGLPIVASRVGGVSDVIEPEVSGWLVAPGDRAGLASGLGEALSVPELAVRRGRTARATVVDRFDFGRSVDRFEELIEGLGGAEP